MTPKERLRNACIGKSTDCTPVVIPYHTIFVRDHWDEVTGESWWGGSDGNTRSSARVEQDFVARSGMDWAGAWIAHSRDYRQNHEAFVRGDVPVLLDKRTGEETELRRWPVGGDHYSVDAPSVCSRQDIDRVVPNRSAREILDSGSLDAARAVIESVGATHGIYTAVNHPSWTYRYFGFEQMMANMVENPSLVDALSERLLADTLEEIEAFAEIGVDYLWVEMCLVGRDSISLDQFRRFVSPYNRPIVEAAKRYGITTVFYVCGDVSDRVEELAACGATCFSFEESKKGFVVDLDSIQRVIGDSACLFGNLDAVGVLEAGSEDFLVSEIARLLEIGNRTGRFVMSLGSPVTPDTPLARVRRYGDITRSRSGPRP
jgi:hypothetical protein